MTASLSALSQRLQRHRRHLDRRVGEARTIATAGQRTANEISELRHQIQLYERAGAILTSLGEDRQSATQQRIEALVTQGLKAIFDDELSFHLVPGVRAKAPVVDFIVRSRVGSTTVDTDVLNARGGGLAQIVGFLLRLVILLLSARRTGETVLFLDEPFAHVSVEYGPRLAEFLRLLVDQTGVQVILVTHTHTEAFLDQADHRYRFDLREGLTHVSAI